jgi:hypothetical protein
MRPPCVAASAHSEGRSSGAAPRTSPREVFRGSPKDVADRLPDAIGAEVGKFERWQDMPATLRAEATTLLEDAHAVTQAPQVARLARDLTAAQTYLTGQTRGIDLLLKSRALQTPAARRAKAVLGGARFLEEETAAVARARADIRAAAQTEFQRIGKRLTQQARELGSADKAVDTIFREELARSPKPIGAEEAWVKVMGALYGDEFRAQQLFTRATERGLINRIATDFPTVDTVRAVDLAARGRYTEQLGSAVEKATAQAGEVPTGADRIVAALTEAVDVEVPRLTTRGRTRSRIYDVMQSHAERVLAENGEEFAEFIEGISPRARASLQGVIGQGLDFIFGTGRRNIVQNAGYGYVLPNVVGFPYALFKQLITRAV